MRAPVVAVGDGAVGIEELLAFSDVRNRSCVRADI
jgi:hypothetical protein